jgi:hypothetical protein
MIQQMPPLSGSEVMFPLTERETWSQQFGIYAQVFLPPPDNFRGEQ